MLIIFTITHRCIVQIVTNMFENKGLLALLEQRGYEVPTKWITVGVDIIDRLRAIPTINMDFASIYQHTVYTPGRADDVIMASNLMLHNLLEQRRTHRMLSGVSHANTDPIIIDHINRIRQNG